MKEATVKRQVTLWLIRGIALLFCCILTILNGGDSHPSHGKTVFEGWERPFLPLVTEEETTGETVMETTTESQETEEITEISETLEETEIETETLPESETPASDALAPEPIIDLGEVMYLPETDTCRLTVTLSDYPRGEVFAFLFLLRIEGDGTFYEVTERRIPEGLTFTYIIYKGYLSVVIDGKTGSDIDHEDVSFAVILHKCEGKIPKITVEYREYTAETDHEFYRILS